MNDINATIGLCNLPHMKRIIKKCRENAKFLTENYKDGKVIHPYGEDFKASYWLFTVLVENKLEYIEKMKEKGFMVSQVHQRNDTHSCFREFKVDLPNLDWIEQRLVCIPCGWWLEKEELI